MDLGFHNVAKITLADQHRNTDASSGNSWYSATLVIEYADVNKPNDRIAIYSDHNADPNPVELQDAHGVDFPHEIAHLKCKLASIKELLKD
jgi:hypothetical protein